MNRIGGGLRAPAGNLREAGVRIRHNANSPKRVELIVPAGDELDVSEEIAAQLRAADTHFEPVDEGMAAPAKKAAPSAKRR
jgi:hypothetical protein